MRSCRVAICEGLDLLPYQRKKPIAADVVRVADGLVAEHWDVLQDEATEAESQSGLPMFGTKFSG
jgi:predicted SnoaL-like aldol condensation-catalyzing enzyme